MILVRIIWLFKTKSGSHFLGVLHKSPTMLESISGLLILGPPKSAYLEVGAGRPPKRIGALIIRIIVDQGLLWSPKTLKGPCMPKDLKLPTLLEAEPGWVIRP